MPGKKKKKQTQSLQLLPLQQNGEIKKIYRLVKGKVLKQQKLNLVPSSKLKVITMNYQLGIKNYY